MDALGYVCRNEFVSLLDLPFQPRDFNPFLFASLLQFCVFGLQAQVLYVNVHHIFFRVALKILGKPKIFYRIRQVLTIINIQIVLMNCEILGLDDLTLGLNHTR